MPAPALPTVDELKLHLRVDHADEDDLIEGYLAAAVDQVEKYLRRHITPKAEELLFPCFATELPILRVDVSAIDSLTYFDAEGNEQTVAPADYRLEVGRRGICRITGVLPLTQERQDAVKLTVTHGMAALPPAIFSALLLIVGTLYENRENEVTGTIVTAHSRTAEALIGPYRLIRV